VRTIFIQIRSSLLQQDLIPALDRSPSAAGSPVDAGSSIVLGRGSHQGRHKNAALARFVDEIVVVPEKYGPRGTPKTARNAPRNESIVTNIRFDIAENEPSEFAYSVALVIVATVRRINFLPSELSSN